MKPYWEKLVKEKDINVEVSSWSDNTGHYVGWVRFETIEDFAKVWDDERWQQILARRAHFFDNTRFRLLRPGLTVPEDLW